MKMIKTQPKSYGQMFFHSLTWLALFGILLPAVKNPSIGQNQPLNQYFELATVSSFEPKISVVDKLSVPTVTVVDNFEQAVRKTSSCLPLNFSADTLLQQASELNLNQPASCFNLSLAQPALPQQIHLTSLSYIMNNVIVKVISAYITLELKTAPVMPYTVPAISLTIFLLLIFVAVKILKAKRLALTQIFLPPVKTRTLSEMGILRC